VAGAGLAHLVDQAIAALRSLESGSSPRHQERMDVEVDGDGVDVGEVQESETVGPLGQPLDQIPHLR
jgi:hypothetical protein